MTVIGYGIFRHAIVSRKAKFILETPFLIITPRRVFGEYEYLLDDASFIMYALSIKIGKCSIDPDTRIIYCKGKDLNMDMFEPVTIVLADSEEKIATITSQPSDYISISPDRTLAILRIMVFPYIDCVGIGTSFLKGTYLHINASSHTISLGWYYACDFTF